MKKKGKEEKNRRRISDDKANLCLIVASWLNSFESPVSIKQVGDLLEI